MKRMALALGIVVALGGAQAPGADASGEVVEKAKTYFNAGAQAYAVGQYPVAVQAFEEAYKLAPRPAIQFSIAQAERRQYFVDRNADHLRRAIEMYRRYVDVVKQGGRRADAVQALSELEPLAAALPAAAAPASSAEPPRPAPVARVMVSSATQGARVSLDGAASAEAPLIGEVKPGRHRVRVVAPGFFDEQRDVVAVEGGLVALDLSLRERPAQLGLAAPADARVFVDGRPAGTTPLARPLELAPGRHLVSVLRNGSLAFSTEVELGRGESRTQQVQLQTSSQRITSYAVFGAGAASLVAGGVFFVLARSRQSSAEAVLEERAAGAISPERLDEYSEARDARDRWMRAGTVATGAGAALGLVGALLYAFDQPNLGDAAAAPRERPAPTTPRPTRPEPGEISATPLLGPGAWGAALQSRF
jgi:hypothetical protein